ncbi:MAG: hypothetical protein QNJ47_04475 [Nostocaceae cyanobacterium]|nr:hypothetical protein [Nostocaceae cyanobacterium]
MLSSLPKQVCLVVYRKNYDRLWHRHPCLCTSRVGIINPLQADRQTGNWQTVTFDSPFPANLQVLVIPMTQTYNRSEIPGLRVRNVTPTSFEIRFDEANILKNNSQYASDGNHTNEEVGWVAYGLPSN